MRCCCGALQQAKIAALEKANHDLGWQVAMLTRARPDQASPAGGRSRVGGASGALSDDAAHDGTGATGS